MECIERWHLCECGMPFPWRYDVNVVRLTSFVQMLLLFIDVNGDLCRYDVNVIIPVVLV